MERTSPELSILGEKIALACQAHQLARVSSSAKVTNEKTAYKLRILEH